MINIEKRMKILENKTLQRERKSSKGFTIFAQNEADAKSQTDELIATGKADEGRDFFIWILNEGENVFIKKEDGEI